MRDLSIPCQVMASHLCRASHCEDTQACHAAIVVKPGIWVLGFCNNQQNTGCRKDVEHFHRDCQGTSASLLVSLKSVKTNPGRSPRRA